MIEGSQEGEDPLSDPLMIPPDFGVHAGTVDGGWKHARASYTIALPVSGLGRLVYQIHEEGPGAPLWVFGWPVAVDRRAMLARMVWQSGLLSGPVERSAAAGDHVWWLMGRGWGRRAWTRLERSGLEPGEAVITELERMVPMTVWKRVVRARSSWVHERDRIRYRLGRTADGSW